MTTANGLQELDVPRGRLIDQDGNSREFRSEIVPRYARRTLAAYLAGVNTRRIRKVLSPLLGQAHLSKSAICQSSGSRSPTWTACT